MTKRIYLDVCCLNRPFDDQTQARIRLESEAILIILSRFEAGDWQWIASQAVDLEIAQTLNEERRQRVQQLITPVHESIAIDERHLERAKALEGLGFGAIDAVHLACAESGNVDVFLTTDDRLLRVARRFSSELHVDVANPLAWVEERLQQ